MLSVEMMLVAYSGACCAWIDGERENPTPEYAEIIRGVVSTENKELRELMRDALHYINRPCDGSWTHLRAKKERDGINERAQELGFEVPDAGDA